ncbi:MAG: hypothetical protein WCE28_25460, partial [Bradyrhizobium sp.]
MKRARKRALTAINPAANHAIRAMRFAAHNAGAALKCRACKTPRYAPPVHMIRLTKERQIAPYAWVHP